MKKILYICGFLILAAMVGVVMLYFTNEGVATELRQVRQPRPNIFFVGIDISATIDSGTLNDFKENVVHRLKNFVGDEAVSYSVSSFGNPGCGGQSVISVVSTQSPKDETTFEWEVEKKIQAVSAAGRPRPGRPLTTPLHYLLEQVLTERPGGRMLIFSDLMNDDSDCPKQYPFPKNAIAEFGKNKEGQVVFLYPTPKLTNTPKLNQRIMDRQQAFVGRMQEMAGQGRVRAFFYHIPDDPEERAAFMRAQLENSIPATTFEIVRERVSKMVDAIVSAVRG